MSKGMVVVGMSGGVDSSAAAYLLHKQGYDVVGITMQIWQNEEQAAVEENGGCCGLSAVEDARRVASQIGIPHYVVNFRDIFRETVIDDFVSEYRQGRTPNPCIRCNRYVKWEALLDKALSIGADYIATGHYARIVHLENGRYAIALSAYMRKDQTYALYNLTQFQLSHTLMPLGGLDKPAVRKAAEEAGLYVARKPDSQDICFVPDGNYGAFIESYTGQKAQPGRFVTKDGQVIGESKGITAYTIGQRKGLGLAMGHPVFVTQIRPETNEVVIGENEDLFSRELYASHVNMMAAEALTEPVRCLGKVRYTQKMAPCTASQTEDGRLHIIFDEPQRAITPGQSAVLYTEEGAVLGGGIIEAGTQPYAHN